MSLLLLAVLAAAPALSTETAPAVAVLARGATLTSEPAAALLQARLARSLAAQQLQVVDLEERFAPPRPRLPSAEKALLDGQKAYDDLDFDAAIARLADAASQWTRTPAAA